ncbi:MAG: alpha-L-fucosidase, partial [Clostridiales bacterium]|nr:alpha-L-fucosidase [Clostridiales bacterium]
MSYKTIVPQPTIGDSSWFTHDRFGMFIHWGTYALAAKHEWYKSRSMVPTEEYMKYFEHFDPDLYNPEAWADAAKDAGMKYFVITTKHHEGFCLWDTKYTDYKVTNTPYGKDVLTPMIDAFRSRGLRTGFYHSLLDWHHPEYTVDRCHPMRENEEYIAQDKNRDIRKYAKYLYNQSVELMSEFGKIDILWYDFTVKEPEGSRFSSKKEDVWQSQKIVDMVRSYHPDILINDRLNIPQDLITPEQIQLDSWLTVNGKPVVWEACQTFSGSWGYYRDEYTWK